jgi:EAL domain-containing protein (putative c-di-GMP-specific phosphodiesterase class I)
MTTTELPKAVTPDKWSRAWGLKLTLGRVYRRPGFILSGAILAILLSAALAASLPSSAGLALDNIQQLLATLVAGLFILRATRASDPGRRAVAHGVLVALVLEAAGLLAWASPDWTTSAAGPALGLFLLAIAILLVTLTRLLFGGLDRELFVPLVLDALIVIVASMTMFFAIWELCFDLDGQDQQTTIALVSAIAIFSGPAAGYLILLHRRIKLSLSGAYALLGGLIWIGVAWIGWLMLFNNSSTTAVSPVDFVYSVGILLVGYGTLTWNLDLSTNAKLNHLAVIVASLFPLVAVGFCLTLSLIIPTQSSLDAVRLGTAVVIGLTLGRQALLTHREGRARLAEREAAARLVNEIAERTQVLADLGHLDVTGLPDQAAQQICEEALRLDGVDNAVIRIFRRDGRAEILAVTGLSDQLNMVGQILSAEWSLQLTQQAAAGSWRQLYESGADPHQTRLFELGLRASLNVPLLWNNQIIGVVAFGSTLAQETMPEGRLTTVREFGLVAAAALGPALTARFQREEVRDGILETIAQRAYKPVFQPVIDLATGNTIGFEALTRFANQQRPDLYFLAADQAGLGLELETACLRESLNVALALPEEAWLSLNVSPALAIAQEPLRSLLAGVRRKIVLEITEHLPVASYDELMGALAGLRAQGIWLAVDDAGSGYAGLQHLLEIKPNIMKLDISLVRAVDQDCGRRALIASMITFARETDCTVLAEGIETAAELDTLRTLGVDLGQGYLLGRPAAIESLVGDGGTVRSKVDDQKAA